MLHIHITPVLTCNYSVDTFIQQRHGGGTVRENRVRSRGRERDSADY